MRTALISLFSLVILGFSSQTLAGYECKSNGNCCQELNQMWQEHFSQDFEMVSSTKYKLNDSFKCPSEQSKLAEGLRALHSLSLSSHALNDYYNHASTTLNNAVYGIVILDIKKSFAATDDGLETIVMSGVHSHSLSPSTYASYIVHETEHVKRSADHVKCLHGQNKGNLSCDEHLGFDLSHDYGAFTSQFLFLDNIRKSKANDLLKKTAQIRMRTLLANKFNQVPKKAPNGESIHDYFDL